MTLDYHANLTKKKFITAMSLRNSDGEAIYSENSLSYSDSTVLEGVINFLDGDIITIEEFRELARTDPWRTMWSLGKEGCLSSSPMEWTDDQKTLVTFAKMYANAYQRME